MKFFELLKFQKIREKISEIRKFAKIMRPKSSMASSSHRRPLRRRGSIVTASTASWPLAQQSQSG